MGLVFNGIQRSRSEGASSWCPSSDEDIWLFLWVETWNSSKDLCGAEAKTIAKHTIATLKKKMRSEKKGYLFWEDVKQKATKWDVHAPTGKEKKSTNKNKRIFRWKSSTWIRHYRPPRLNLTLLWWGGFPPRSFYPRASTRKAQLSLAAKVVRPTDLHKNVRYWFTID